MAMKNCRPRLFLGKRKSRLDGRLFTVTERLAIAQRIAERLCPPGETRQGQRTDLDANAAKFEKGKTADIIARQSGLGSAETLKRAQKVVEHGAPELVEAMGLRTLELCQLCQICRLGGLHEVMDWKSCRARHIFGTLDSRNRQQRAALHNVTTPLTY